MEFIRMGDRKRPERFSRTFQVLITGEQPGAALERMEKTSVEAMVSDGFVTFIGHWAGCLAFIHHKSIYHHLSIYNLGFSDDPAEYRLAVDLQERKVYIEEKNSDS